MSYMHRFLKWDGEANLTIPTPISFYQDPRQFHFLISKTISITPKAYPKNIQIKEKKQINRK